MTPESSKKELRICEYRSNIRRFKRLKPHVERSVLYYYKEAVMVSLTDGAVTKFKEVVSQQGTAGDGVRIFLVPGG